MTINPPRLQELVDEIERKIGPFSLGVVGDGTHFFGYHLGADECPAGDYSTVLKRDRSGIDRYGGQFASAIDIGMGWPAARDWLRWLLDMTASGEFPDIREIIGSLDGRECFLYDASTKVRYERAADDHVTHTHVSFYRDSALRDKKNIIKGWTANRFDGHGRPNGKPTSAVRDNSPVPTPGVTEFPDSMGDFPTTALCVIAVASGVAWIIRRRMEIAREDSS